MVASVKESPAKGIVPSGKCKTHKFARYDQPEHGGKAHLHNVARKLFSGLHNLQPTELSDQSSAKLNLKQRRD